METNQVIAYAASAIFYLVSAVLAFLGAFTAYIFIRYGRSPIIAVIASVLFAFMFLTISGRALTLLHSI